MNSLTIKDSNFILNGNKFVIHSAAFHYFRTPAYYWRDRLLKIKECGFNTVETYIAWNLHEPEENEFDFSGDLDVAKFIDMAKELGLFVIIRPGPYICAEWEYGGLPYWLLKYNNIGLRFDEPIYLQKVERYIGEISKILAPRMFDNGGNIILLQIENEYGSFGNDKIYLQKLKDLYIKNGVSGLFFTADAPDEDYLKAGCLDGVLVTGNFGDNVERKFKQLQQYENNPVMCAEFWCGWFDHWHEQHHFRKPQKVAKAIEPFFTNGHSFNLYMACGGTNFGFMNGANNNGDGYKPTVTSYDYDALISECGDRTEKYYEIRKLFEKYVGGLKELTAKETLKLAYNEVQFSKVALLFDNLDAISKSVFSVNPLTMEQVGQGYGYILYSSEISCPVQDSLFTIDNLGDRAQVFVDGVKQFTIERGFNDNDKFYLTTTKPNAKLDILIENMGRINYGPFIYDKKGMTGARLFNRNIFRWNISSLPMKDLSSLKYQDELSISSSPAFYKGTFNVDKLADTFIRPSGFSKGFIVVNGINIGRFYNEAGPQKSFYIPACYLHLGENEIIVFDSEGANELKATFEDTPDYGDLFECP